VATSSLLSYANSGSHHDLQAKEITQIVYLYFDFFKSHINIKLKSTLTTARVKSRFFYSLEKTLKVM
jgi:hypothetical protein